MRIKWNKQSFRALEECWQSGERISPERLSKREKALKGRYEEIECFVESDRIWPPVQSPERQKFNKAFRGVLSRLPPIACLHISC